MRKELREVFVSTYDQLGLAAGDVGDDEPLFGPDARFGLDSMDTLKFIAVLHERYQFDIGSAKTDTFRTIARIEESLAAQRA
ncbi:acyl carrier protein [Lentzea sp. NPDC055074]